MSGKQAFSFSQGLSKTMGARAGAEAGAGARASRTILKILYKSFLEYLRVLVAVSRATAMRGFVFKGLMGYSDNLSPESEGGKKLRRVIERATEGCSQQRRLRP